MIEITRTYSFEAAHWLPFVAAGHKCGRVHGHSYSVTVAVRAESLPLTSGWVMDFGDIDSVCSETIRELDHSTLNDTINNPTSERLAAWLAARWAVLPGLAWVRVSETPRSSATWYT